MATGRVRHFFPGGNTPQGFFSYYNYIIPADANRIFILKGGPGTGKSSFMRKTGEALLAQGYDLEYHHCSSDNNSLDGLVIPALKVAFIDGTAPHVVDPKNPGCVDEIIHLGDYWNETEIAKNKAQILTCNAEISNNFQRAYRLLKAAKLLYDDLAIHYTEALNTSKANEVGEELISKILDGITTIGSGKIRKLFASAITPDGPVNYLESSVCQAKSCHIINGDPGTGKSTVVQKIINATIIKGLDVEVFYCPLDPEKPEHVYIPQLDIAITTSNMPHVYRVLTSTASSETNMNDYLDLDMITKYEEIITYDQNLFWELWSRSIACIQQAKQLHDKLETFYVPNMNFQAVQTLWEKTYERVLSYKN